MKKNYNVLRLISPTILCFLVIYTTGISIDYYPLFFGIIISLTNWNLHKLKPLSGMLLNILTMYISYFLAFGSIYLISELINVMFINDNYFVSDESKGLIGFVIGSFIIAPLLVFLSIKFVFGFPKTKQTVIIISTSIVFLVLYFCLAFYYEITGKPYVVWQLVMALAVQLLVYQKEPKRS